MKNLFIKFIKEEEGLALIEYVMILATIGLVIVAARPYFDYYIIGDDDNPGLSRTLFNASAQGLSDVGKGLIVHDGCDPVSTNVKAYDCDQL